MAANKQAIKKLKENGPDVEEKSWWDFMTLDARAARIKRLAEEAKKKKEKEAKEKEEAK